MRPPLWLRPLAFLAITYLGIMAVVALGMSETWHSWDWKFLNAVAAQRQPQFSRKIVVADIQNYDFQRPEIDRAVTARFLEAVIKKPRDLPAAVIVDFSFSKQKVQSPAFARATAAFDRALDDARRAGVPVFGTVSSRAMVEQFGVVDWDHLNELDWRGVYDHLSGFGHTLLSTYQDGLFYQACYARIPKFDEDGNQVGMTEMPALPELAFAEIEKRSDAKCDGSAMRIVSLGPHEDFDRLARDRLSGSDPLPQAHASLLGDYVIVASLSYDQDPGLTRTNPELLAWALSDLLTSGEESFYDPAPLGDILIVLIIVFSLITVGLFVAAFLWLRRQRLGSNRLGAPWLAAGAAALGTLALFFGLETLLLAVKRIQPQVSLVSLSVIVTAGLAGMRGRQILLDQITSDDGLQESNDFDVFISYAHEEMIWVRQTIYKPLSEARLLDGRPLRIFFDTRSLEAGVSWQARISLAIDGSKFFVPVYSETYFKRKYCLFEIRRALRKWIALGESSRCVLPIMRGHPQIDPSVDDIQAVNIDDDPEVVNDIVAEIVGRISDGEA